ncbi:inositol polyphosphate multikinase [Terrapene carolina triunguis]|uniref:inositol polyphosphate multikinase n=1 Tax=Terrapene triunguis TaxID=2587831 RepID=UPI001156BC50|nr:inositol polyphosphate multikinase [Terrapene carolina triunguis]
MATEPPRRAPPPPAGRPDSGQRRAGDGEEAEPLRGSALEPSSPSVAVGGGRQGLLNGCVPLSHQVAGHMYGKDKGGFYTMLFTIVSECGVLSLILSSEGESSIALKERMLLVEAMLFNEQVYAADCCDSVLLELRKYLPKYFGSWSPPTAPNDLYLKLEDVTRKFNKPCIMDVKIGQKSYDPYASAEKIQQQVSKYPLMEEIGFLVLGMRVYHIHSDSYETQNQHYGRSLTKETIKDGMSRFFHNGYCLRKDAVAASIQKIEKILQWFESQEQLNFYASSLLFVYEGSCQLTATRLGDGTLAEKRVVPKGLLQDGDLLEYNNNIHVINSTENGKIEASVGKSLPKIYTFHKKAYSKRHHSQISLKTENLEQDNVWKSSTCISQEHLNGNVIPQLEKVFCHMPKEMKENADVEIKMIDFAHVFPSNTKDKGYIYGLKNLITVLQNILDN